MNRRELVIAAAQQGGLETKQVDAAFRAITEVLTAVVAKGEPVTVSGFAKFAKVERAARMGRNPQTGAAVRIKASKRARITPLKAFKDSVMTPSLAPKLAKGVWPPAPAAPRAAVKKAPATKAAPAKKAVAPVKKAPVKKAPARKAPAKKAPAKRA
ncbi:MAG TPA: HU family DNA-binding protein [Acidimicrobiales bacterium]|jgi:DNA-binding protein HU-beta